MYKNLHITVLIDGSFDVIDAHSHNVLKVNVFKNKYPQKYPRTDSKKATQYLVNAEREREQTIYCSN